MAPTSDCAHKEREGSRGAIFAHIPGYHSTEAAHRQRRYQRWSLQIRQIGTFRHKKSPVYRTSSNTQRPHKTITFGSC